MKGVWYNTIMSAVIHYRGFIRDGVIVPEVPLPYVEGAAVTFDIQEVTKELTGEEKPNYSMR